VNGAPRKITLDLLCYFGCMQFFAIMKKVGKSFVLRGVVCLLLCTPKLHPFFFFSLWLLQMWQSTNLELSLCLQMLLNPLYVPGSRITSPFFDTRVRALARKYLWSKQMHHDDHIGDRYSWLTPSSHLLIVVCRPKMSFGKYGKDLKWMERNLLGGLEPLSRTALRSTWNTVRAWRVSFQQGFCKFYLE
jgi:hypothetical protein